MLDEYIQISDLHKTYTMHGASLQVLRGINLPVNKGEIFGIIGFSGAGKSMLARCINRLETPDSSRIQVGGADILRSPKKALLKERRKIGVVFQTLDLFEAKTMYRNIPYPLEINGVPKEEIKDRVLRIIELVELTDKFEAYPGGLFGGQKQRVGVMRALVNSPDLLLSGEATSASDPQTTLQILDLLKRIDQTTGITTLMITYELDTIKYTCEHMAVLEDGLIIESGPVSEIFSNPHSRTGGLFARVFFGLQYSGELVNGEGIQKTDRPDFRVKGVVL